MNGLQNAQQFSRMSILVALCLIAGTLCAHESSTIELEMDADARKLRVEMDLLDLDQQIGIGSATQQHITAGDIQARRRDINTYVAQNLRIDGCPMLSSDSNVGIRAGRSVRVAVDFTLACERLRGQVSISSSLFDSFPGYRTVIQVNQAAGSEFYSFADGGVSFELDGKAGVAGFVTFVVQGVWHILLGVDHLAFLLLLVLPLAFTGSVRERCVATLRIVTAFTVAHSITLALSALGHISLPPAPVELIIAASVVLAALLNLFGKSRHIGWPVAYVFGLVHGFGFAGAFGELASGANLHWSDLLAFNVGVEIGQVAFVLVALTTLYWIERFYRHSRILVPAGSVVAGLAGTLWMLERL